MLAVVIFKFDSLGDSQCSWLFIKVVPVLKILVVHHCATAHLLDIAGGTPLSVIGDTILSSFLIVF